MSAEYRPEKTRQARIAAMGALWLAAIVLCILFVDRPASTYSHDTFHRAAIFVLMQRASEAIMCLGVITLLAGSVGTLFVASGGRWLAAIRLGVGPVLAWGFNTQLKLAFGRTWPDTFVNQNPSWIQNGVYGFTPFHGGPGWASFPSGHTSIAFGAASIVWIEYPRLRWLACLVCGVEIVGLYGADYHFVGDMLGGALVGTVVGALVSRTMRSHS